MPQGIISGEQREKEIERESFIQYPSKCDNFAE